MSARAEEDNVKLLRVGVVLSEVAHGDIPTVVLVVSTEVLQVVVETNHLVEAEMRGVVAQVTRHFSVMNV